MGRIPHFSELLFPAESVAIIQVISNFALIFFMFIVGCVHVATHTLAPPRHRITTRGNAHSVRPAVVVLLVCASMQRIVSAHRPPAHAACSLELDPVKLKADLKMAMWISGWGIVVPFLAACLLAILFQDPEFSQTSFIKLSLFLTCAIGMSALPVLARILSERRMLATRLGVRTFASLQRAVRLPSLPASRLRACIPSPAVVRMACRACPCPWQLWTM